MDFYGLFDILFDLFWSIGSIVKYFYLKGEEAHHNMVIIALSGKQGSGKSTIATGLGYPVMKYAGPLYEMHDACVGVMAKYGVKLMAKQGRLLQLLGTEWGRQVLGEDVWVRVMDGQLAKASALPVVVIDDVRFPNELEFLKSRGALCVRLEADEDRRAVRAEKWRDDTGHPSETALDAYSSEFDIILDTGRMDIDSCIDSIRRHLG